MNINKIFVIGAGTMGTGIAQTAIQSGFKVDLYDSDRQYLDRAFSRIESSFEKKISKNKLTRADALEIIGKLNICSDLSSVSSADLIIEAITENLDIKKELFTKVSKLCKKNAVLASNTSTISITSIASSVTYPENFVGMHFFNPVPVMKLLEIVKGHLTSDETIETIKSIGKRLDKVTIISKDTSGFIINKMLSPMLNTAVNLVDSGVGSIEDIDNGMKFGCSHPMGPLELIDLVGADVQLAVMEVLYEESGDTYYKPAPLLRRMVDSGELGRKTGKGFYTYNKSF